MGRPSVEERLDNVEAQLRALDNTMGNFMESARVTEASTGKNIKHIENQILVLSNYVNYNLDADTGKIVNSLRDIVKRLTGFEKQLDVIQDNTSEPSSPSLRAATPNTSESSSPSLRTATPLNVIKVMDFETEGTQLKIKELEERLTKAEDDRDQTQALLLETQTDLEQWKTEFNTAEAAHADIEKMLNEKIDAEKRISQNLFRKIQEMKGNIRVMCRIRPAPTDATDELVDFGPREKSDFNNSWGKFRMPVERKNAMGMVTIDKKSFDFERIFGPDETNNDIFNEISDLIECALDGEKVGVFAYGQTGSGKTYTLSNKDLGKGASNGIIPRTLASMFEIAGRNSDRYKYTISLSVLEIYINHIYDLLHKSEDGQKTETRLEQATVAPLESLSRAEEIIEEAISIRTSSSTLKNETSSRSHLIITFRVTRETIADGSVVEGLLNLVDLAGSERSAADGLQGTQLQEGILINKSLLSLNRVITSLGQGTVVTFDTALTRALRPCLSHDSKTLMFVMVSPFKKDLSVSLQTLEKGQEATNAKLVSAGRNDTRRTSTTPPTSKNDASPGSGSKVTPSTPTRNSTATTTTPLRGGASSGRGNRGRGTSISTPSRPGRGARGGAPRTPAS